MISEQPNTKQIHGIILEFLALLSEIPKEQTPQYLSVVESLLHLIADLETHLDILRHTLERERLVNNDLVMVQANVVEDDP